MTQLDCKSCFKLGAANFGGKRFKQKILPGFSDVLVPTVFGVIPRQSKAAKGGGRSP
jgi:hypothetical protein